jgi:hypothetical protein
VTTRTIAATFSLRRDAERACRALVERAHVPEACIDSAGYAQYPDEDGLAPAREGIVAAQVAEERAERVRSALMAAGGDIVIDEVARDGRAPTCH